MKDIRSMGEKLEDLRKNRCWSLDDAEEHSGASRSAISTIENKGEIRGNIISLMRLASCYNVSSDWLLGLSDCEHIETDKKVTCKTLGLSSKAVDNICAIPNAYKKELDALLASPSLKRIVEIIEYCGRKVSSLLDEINNADSVDTQYHIALTEIRHYQRDASEDIEQIIRGITQYDVLENLLKIKSGEK